MEAVACTLPALVWVILAFLGSGGGGDGERSLAINVVNKGASYVLPPAAVCCGRLTECSGVVSGGCVMRVGASEIGAERPRAACYTQKKKKKEHIAPTH